MKYIRVVCDQCTAERVGTDNASLREWGVKHERKTGHAVETTVFEIEGGKSAMRSAMPR